jgi:ribosome-binding ATPase YchF (GTP1/OBG family)
MTATVKNLNEAFDGIVDEDSGLSIQDRFDLLGQEIIAHSYFIMERQRKTHERMTAEEKLEQQDSVEQFNIIEKIFTKLKKAGRLSNVSANDHFDEQLLKRIQSKKSTIGEIVRELPTK